MYVCTHKEEINREQIRVSKSRNEGGEVESNAEGKRHTAKVVEPVFPADERSRVAGTSLRNPPLGPANWPRYANLPLAYHPVLDLA